MMNTTYLTTKQASERLALHQESVRRLCRSGKIPAIRIGKRLRIPVAELEAIEAANRVGRGYLGKGGTAS